MAIQPLLDNESRDWEQNIVKFFQSKGVRWTVQRQLILKALDHSEGHVSAEDIYQQVTRQFPGFNLSTVYRTLELLCEMGVMTKVPDQGDGRDRFELIGETPHHHLTCKNCAQVIAMDENLVQTLKDQVYRSYGFVLNLNHFMGYGLCRKCSAA